MTTKAAEELYRAQHNLKHEGKSSIVWNPLDLPLDNLPTIYGFNNGGSPGWFHAQLIAEDGTALGSHLCSHEGYMPADLGIIEGGNPQRHKTFREHFPNGYRMEFVGYDDVHSHEGLNEAIRRNNQDKGE